MNETPNHIMELCANLDDVSAEVIAGAMTHLLADGALEAWATPITMKKSRPGTLLSVLCAAESCDRLARRMIELTGTFGVRYRSWDRLVLDRRHETVETPFGPIRIKLGILDGRIVAAKPEYADVAAAAEAHGQPVRRVMLAAQGAATWWLETSESGSAS